MLDQPAWLIYPVRLCRAWTTDMNSQTLKLNLEKKFKIVCFYDLADAMCQHGTIFKIFKQHYKSVFDPNDRLVFYTEHVPTQIVLDHLQRAATKIDISNFFIIVCTPHNIVQPLTLANDKYGNDDVVISNVTYHIQGSKQLVDDAIYPFDTFCTVPFSMLSVGTDSAIRPCCKYAVNLGSAENTSLKDAFNSPLMLELRRDIKQGIKHQHCKTCWDIEGKGNISLRNHFLDKNIEVCDQEWVDQLAIRDLTVSPSNLCNFKCRVCNSTASSRIASEEIKFSKDLIEIQELKKYNSQLSSGSLLDKIHQIVDDLKFLHILGGEPFLWKELEALIDQLVSAGHAKDICIEFNTNGSVFPKKIFNKLLAFQSVEILLSIDDVGKRFELQRGGRWDQVLENILQFKNQQSNNVKIKIAPTVNIQNLFYLDHLVEFCDINNLEIVWWFLENPDYLSIDRVTAATKTAVYNKYINHPNVNLQQIANRMHLSPPVSGQAFIDHMTKLDQRRNQDSAVILKEIFDLMSS